MVMSSPKQNTIYTLAQSETTSTAKQKPFVLISGNGTSISETQTLKNRAKRKVITQSVILMLIDIAKKKGDNERVQQYWNTYHCQNKLYLADSNLHSYYCKNRFCTICCAIRKADIINRYYPELQKWKEPHFVTLTVKAIPAKNLQTWVKGMNQAFKLIINRCKKKHQRGKGIKLMGVRSLECNFNPKKRTYNPHFHIIVPNKQIAEVLKKEWMLQWNKTATLHASHKAQHIVKINNLDKALIETIKYGSKIFTEPDIKKNKNSSLQPIIYAKALDNIFTAMKERRIFERFGFNLPKQQKQTSTSKLAFNYQTFQYKSTVTDWVNTETGECLTGYLLPTELEYLLQYSFNTKAQ